MNEIIPDQSRLLDEAIDLVIRLQNDPENAVAIQMVRAWRAQGPQHERMWARVSKAYGASGTILTERQRTAHRENLGLTRRNLVVGGLVLLGGGLSAYTIGPDLLRKARADYATAKGEIKRVRLSDGSVATLGPESAITLDFQGTDRNIDLLAGMSFFEVHPDPARPFSVQSGGLRATAFGTAFDLSNDAGILMVSVDHGMVEAWAPGSTLATGEKLHEGQWLIFDPSSETVDRGRRDAGQVATWRDNLIIAEKETVSALVARIGRWIPGRIVMAAPFIGNQRVSGVYDLNDPLRALEAVVHPVGARVRRMTSFMTVISPV